jgi:predicted outer membrane repeat protein
MYVESSSVFQEFSASFLIQNNTATNGDGGGILCSRCWFEPERFNASYNRAINGHGGFMAIIQPDWFAISIGTLIHDCHSDGNGGGIYLLGGPPFLTLTIEETSFVNCSSLKGGGAIYMADISPLIVTSCTFNNNNAVYGNDIASIATSLQLRSRSSIGRLYSPAQLIDPIIVELKDLFNQTVSTDSMTVIAVGLKSGTLSGSPLQRVTKGVSNFTDLRIIGDIGKHTIVWNAYTFSVELDVNNTGLCSSGTTYSIDSGMSHFT